MLALHKAFKWIHFEVQDFEEGKAELPKAQAPEAVKQLVKKADEIPTRPPMPFEFTADPSTINAQDLWVFHFSNITFPNADFYPKNVYFQRHHQADGDVRRQKWSPIPDAIDDSRGQELPVRLPQTRPFQLQLLHQTRRAVHQGMCIQAQCCYKNSRS